MILPWRELHRFFELSSPRMRQRPSILSLSRAIISVHFFLKYSIAPTSKESRSIQCGAASSDDRGVLKRKYSRGCMSSVSSKCTVSVAPSIIKCIRGCIHFNMPQDSESSVSKDCFTCPVPVSVSTAFQWYCYLTKQVKSRLHLPRNAFWLQCTLLGRGNLQSSPHPPTPFDVGDLPGPWGQNMLVLPLLHVRPSQVINVVVA